MVQITLTILRLSVKRGVGKPVNVCCCSFQNHFLSFFFFLIVMENNTFTKAKAATVFLRSY